MSADFSARGRKLPAELEAQLRALDGNPDLADIPEAPEEHWARARRLHAREAENASRNGVGRNAARAKLP